MNRVVKKRMGVRKASFAGGADTEQLTGMAIGGVTPFGLPDDLPLWVDGQVMTRDRIILVAAAAIGRSSHRRRF